MGNTIKTTTPSPKIRWAIFIVIALLALAVRLPQLGERPMHTDESINAYVTGELLAGEKYHYDPQDRHGPALYLLAKPIAQLCGAKNFSGLTETQLRLSTVLTGTATILLFGAGVEMFGFIPCLVAALLFACAPLPVYYNRYFIHETLFVAATFGLILSGNQMLKKNSFGFAALAGLCAALMLACKETAVIHFFALGAAAFIGWFAGGRQKFPALKMIAASFIVFVAGTILLFTWGGQNWTALADLFRAIPNFAARAGGEGHEKSFGYYVEILGVPAALGAVAAMDIFFVFGISDRCFHKERFFLVAYGLLIFLIYSSIPYKTPWLALNLWLPLTLILGFATERVWLKIRTTFHYGLFFSVVALSFIALGVQTKKWVFDKPADEKNPYAYAHTGEDLLRLPVRLEELAQQNKISNPRIAVVAADAWPLPWYLRKFSQVGFWQPGQETGAADFFLTSTDVPDRLAERLKNFRAEYFGWRPEVLLVLWTPAPAEKKP